MKSRIDSFPGFLPLIFLTMAFFMAACSHEDLEVRHQDEIMGVWTDGDGSYMEFMADNTLINLKVSYQDNESIGDWTRDVYFYEPGYEIVIYLFAEVEGYIYKIINLDEKELVWCRVKELNLREDYENGMAMGEIIGNIINEAHEGFETNPADYVSFTKVPVDEFYDMIQNIDIMEPWWDYFE